MCRGHILDVERLADETGDIRNFRELTLAAQKVCVKLARLSRSATRRGGRTSGRNVQKRAVSWKRQKRAVSWKRQKRAVWQRQKCGVSWQRQKRAV